MASVGTWITNITQKIRTMEDKMAVGAFGRATNYGCMRWSL